MSVMNNHNLWALCADLAESVLAEFDRQTQGVVKAERLPSANDGVTGSYSVRNGVAVITVDGPIDRKARISWFTGEPYTAGQEQIRISLEAAMRDPAVKAILLSFNSPGGVVAGTKELADFIASCGKRKPCASYADGMCASAAFWLASATGSVYAPLTAQVGSIGVIAVLTEWTKAAEKSGFNRTVIHSGKFKAAGHPDKALSEEERALFQSQLDQLHAIFVHDVAANLSLPLPEGIPSWAEGQTFLGNDARATGLVTETVSDLDGAIAALSAKIREPMMDLKELKASHPDLVEQILAEARPGQEETLAAAVEDNRKDMLELLACIAGPEIAAKLAKIQATGITAVQLKELAPMLAQPAGQEPKPESSEEKLRKEMLAALQAAHGGPVSTGPEAAPKSALVADAERRCK